VKKILILLILLILALNVSAVRVSLLNTDPFPARAGEFVDVFVNFENNASGDSAPITATVIPKDSFRLAFGQDEVKQVGSIPQAQSTFVKYRLQVSDDAIDGENEIEIKFKEGTRELQSVTLKIEVNNELPNIEIGDIESEPKKILPDTGDVKLTITLLNTRDSSQ